MFIFIPLYIIIYTGMILLMTEKSKEEIRLEILNEKLEDWHKNMKPPKYNDIEK
jgi:hypothetical protein